MIKILNGIHETVAYDAFHGLQLYHNVETENYPVHWHSALELIMPVQNDYTVIIDKVSHTLHEGDIWIIPPGTLHELIAPPTGERLIVLFDYSLICNIKDMDSLLHTLHPFTLITEQEHPELNRKLAFYLEEITREYDNPIPFTEASIYSLAMRFFVTLARASFSIHNRFPGIMNNRQHEYVEKFLSICSYISDHCSENITIDEIAGKAGFSKYHFARLFKQFANMSCYEYLTKQRIAHAERLLIEPDLSITEVAMQTGFNSLSTFNRIFKAAKNCTPSEYKNLNRMQ